MNQFEELRNQVNQVKEDIFGPIVELLESAEDDASKYYEKGVQSAGNRLKKTMQEVRKTIHHPTAKSKLVELQNSAKNLRQSIIDASKKN